MRNDGVDDAVEPSINRVKCVRVTAVEFERTTRRQKQWLEVVPKGEAKVKHWANTVGIRGSQTPRKAQCPVNMNMPATGALCNSRQKWGLVLDPNPGED